MLVCMYVRTYACMHASMYTCVYVCMYVCMYVRMNTHAYTCSCVSVCMCVYVRASGNQIVEPCVYVYVSKGALCQGTLREALKSLRALNKSLRASLHYILCMSIISYSETPIKSLRALLYCS